jgi:hypothetical protein
MNQNPEFQMSEKEWQTYLDWEKTLPVLPSTTIGGSTTFCFTPTSVGVGINVRRVDGHEKDITDYESW